jgi:hypothetical protein
MAYPLMVALTMFVLPIGSICIEWGAGHAQLLWLIGKWFVFWGVGVRLLIAGFRQYFQPAFTSRHILGIETPDVFVLVRELGGANIAAGAVGLVSLALPSFVLPAAISAAIFYAVAGAEHVKSSHRGANENIAMVSDIFIAALLVGFAATALLVGLR